MSTYIIELHGTFDADLAADRIKWWESHSPFNDRLKELVGPETEFEIIQHGWSGENSDRARRKAASALTSRLHNLDKDDHEFHLIGHSHGGSIITLALENAASTGKIFQGLKSITTVGTPFYEYKANSFSSSVIIDTLKLYAHEFRNLFLLGLSVLLFFYLYLGHSPIDEYRIFSKPLGYLFWGTFIVFNLYFIWRGIPIMRSGFRLFLESPKSRRQRKGRNLWDCLEKWTFIFDQDDEAIIGLSYGIRTETIPIFKTMQPSTAIMLLTNIFNVVLPVTVLILVFALPFSLLLLLLSGGFALAEIAFPTKTIMAPCSLWPWCEDLYWRNIASNLLYIVMLFPGIGGLVLISATLFVFAGNFIVRILRIPFQLFDLLMRFAIGPWLDGIVTGRFKSVATGEDAKGFSVEDVGFLPSYALAMGKALPDIIHTELKNGVDRNAARTLSRVRGFLGAASLGGSSVELFQKVSKELAWDELIHTSYFPNSKITELIAYGIVYAERNGLQMDNLEQFAEPETSEWFHHVRNTTRRKESTMAETKY